MVTRNVVLTEQQSAFVDGLLAPGLYQNSSEALRAGLRKLERDELAWEEFRREVLEGLDLVRRGELVEGDGADVMRRAFAEGSARK